MNAGLSNLATLKGHLLGADIRARTTWDTQIADVGLFVAEMFDDYCNRQFPYAGGQTKIIEGQREHYYLPRFPIVSVASVETRYQQSDAWTAHSDQPFQLNPETGLVEFLWNISPAPGQIRITWTGGYFFNTLEPADVGYPTALPAGATALPAKLKGAWLLQCRAAWQAIDKTGVDITTTGSSSQFVTGSLSSLQLLPMVESTLKKLIRYQLT